MSQNITPTTSLPQEIMFMISDLLTLHDVSAWLQTSSFFAQYLEAYLYSRLATHALTPKKTVIAWAAEQGHASVLEKINAHKASSIPVEISTQALCYAAKHNHLDAARVLLKMGANVNDEACIKYEWVYTALHEAAAASHIEMARLLLDNGASVHAVGSASGGWFADDTVLEWAALNANMDMIKFLLDEGADVTTAGVIKRAVQSQRVEVVEFLLDKGARLHGPYENDSTHLYWSIVAKNLPMVKLLLERGADPNENSGSGTALHTAADTGNVEAVKMLFEYGADVNAVDEYDDVTPLHKAVSMPEVEPKKPFSRVDVVLFLLDHGADPFRVNANGDSPIEEARCWGKPQIIKILKEAMKKLRPDTQEWVHDETDDESQEEEENIDERDRDRRPRSGVVFSGWNQ